MNYNNSNNISTRENATYINSYEGIDNQSDSISTEIKYKDIKAYSSDSITEENNSEFDNSISSATNLITKSTNFITDSQTINQLNMTNKVEEAGEKIYDLLNEI